MPPDRSLATDSIVVGVAVLVIDVVDVVGDELPLRIAAIRTRIAMHGPKLVVFYGIGYGEHWKAIIGTKFEPVQNQRFQVAATARTKFVLAPHPVATGVGNADFEAIGEWLRSG